MRAAHREGAEEVSGESWSVVKRIRSLPFQFGGEEHSGWLPPGAAVPLPTPVQNVLLDIEIQFDGAGGYLLCYAARDHAISGDTWHETLTDAQSAAADMFDVDESEWEQPD
jgi:hypothetical protein